MVAAGILTVLGLQLCLLPPHLILSLWSLCPFLLIRTPAVPDAGPTLPYYDLTSILIALSMTLFPNRVILRHRASDSNLSFRGTKFKPEQML